MTVQTTNNSNTFSGNDATTTFDTTFKFFVSSDVVVVLTDTSDVDTTLTLGVDYSVSGGSAVGAVGTITYPLSGDPLATGETLTVYRDRPYTQTLDLLNQGAWAPESVEAAFDKNVMLSQQLKAASDRTLVLPVTVGGISSELPKPSADKVLGWDAAGTAIENKTVNSSSYLTIPLAVAEGGTGGTSQATARAGLGIEDGMATVQHKFDATVAPTTTDDSSAGYAVGSVWVDITGDRFYVCVDASVGAAVWESRLELTDENLYAAQQRMTLQTDTSSTNTVDFDFAGGDCFIDLTENITSITISNLPENAWATLIIQQGAGGNTVTGWPAAVLWPGDTEPVVSTTDNAYDVFSFYKKGTDIIASVSQDHR